MSDNNDGLAAVGLVGGVLGLLLIAGLASGGSTTRERLPAPKKPRRLPARRVHEWPRSIVDECGIEHIARSYAPSMPVFDAPWVVTGWYDVARDAEVIRVEFDPDVFHRGLSFAVRWGEEFTPDRSSFRRSASQLWPDDKWNDRVVHRYGASEATGCFLVSVTVGDETIDFYHEPERPERLQTAQKLLTAAAPSPDSESQWQDAFKQYQRELAEIRLRQDELAVAPLHEDDKSELARFLEQRTREARTKYLATSNSMDYFTVRK